MLTAPKRLQLESGILACLFPVIVGTWTVNLFEMVASLLSYDSWNSVFFAIKWSCSHRVKTTCALLFCRIDAKGNGDNSVNCINHYTQERDTTLHFQTKWVRYLFIKWCKYLKVQLLLSSPQRKRRSSNATSSKTVKATDFKLLLFWHAFSPRQSGPGHEAYKCFEDGV